MAVTYRFLFDECLALELTDLAHSFGYEATSVRDLNKLGESDNALALFAIERDWVFVTNNRVDHVRIFARFELHNGLVVIVPNTDTRGQLRLFAGFAEQLEQLDDLVNCLVDIYEDGSFTVTEWPPARPNEVF